MERTAGNRFALEKIGSLPSIPGVLSQVTAIVSNPSSSIGDLTRAIEIDQAAAAKSLQITNSAAFGLYSRVTSLHQACALLGMRMIRNVVLQTSLMQQYQRLRSIQAFDLDGFWRHTTLVASFSRTLAVKAGAEAGFSPEEAYTAGLLHDIGTLVLLDHRTEEYLEAQRRFRQDEVPLLEAESTVFGLDHAQVGAFLAQNWKFPEKICAAIRGHHSPPLGDPHEAFALLVCEANAVVESLEEGKAIAFAESADPRFFQKLPVSAERLDDAVADLVALFPSVLRDT